MDILNMKTENLKLAQLRYFDQKHNGVEIPKLKAYVFLFQMGDSYVNILNPGEELPVYKRVPYCNTTKSGEDYGTKIVLSSGEVKDGPCYVIENLGSDRLFEEKTISLEQLEDYVIASKLFFIDRLHIMEERGVFPLSPKYRDDIKKNAAFHEYMEKCIKENSVLK